MSKCVNYIYPNWAYGKLLKYKCNKEALFIDEGGRDLCTKHFKKWYKKRYKEEYKP